MPEVSIHDLVQATDLLGIETVKLSAERLLADTSEPSDVTPAYEVNTATRDDGAGFRIILRTVIDASIGRIECDVAAEYEMTGTAARDVPLEVFEQYVNDVSIMHILPFTRQAIADITLRVFMSPLMMPIMQRGSLHFEIAHGLREAAVLSPWLDTAAPVPGE